MIPRLLFLLCSFTLLCTGVRAQKEADYIAALAVHLDARTEVSVTSGRVDLETATHAIEVERAPKWKNSIGQALWYGLQTSKKPGIILLIESPEQRKYAIQLGSALDYAGLGNSIDVWLWPDDFPGVNPTSMVERQAQPVAGTGTYWLNLNGNKRHKSSCRWYKNTARGRLCTVAEGTPAGCCH
jgi:hypothetical protein